MDVNMTVYPLSSFVIAFDILGFIRIASLYSMRSATWQWRKPKTSKVK